MFIHINSFFFFICPPPPQAAVLQCKDEGLATANALRLQERSLAFSEHAQQ